MICGLFVLTLWFTVGGLRCDYFASAGCLIVLVAFVLVIAGWLALIAVPLDICGWLWVCILVFCY